MSYEVYGHLIYGVKVEKSMLLSEIAIKLDEFNQNDWIDIDYLSAGRQEDPDFFLIAHHEEAVAGSPVAVEPDDFSAVTRDEWCDRLKEAAEYANLKIVADPGWILIADNS